MSVVCGAGMSGVRCRERTRTRLQCPRFVPAGEGRSLSALMPVCRGHRWHITDESSFATTDEEVAATLRGLSVAGAMPDVKSTCHLDEGILGPRSEVLLGRLALASARDWRIGLEGVR